MRQAILLLAICASLSAQTLTLSGPASAKPGATVNVTLSVTGSTGSSALQWTVGYPAGGYTATVTAGVAAASKTLTCTASKASCLLVGNNATPIGNGVLATYALKIPLTAPAGSTPIPLSGLLGASPTGNPVAITAGAAYNLLIQTKEDVNGDGTVTAADVVFMTNQVLAAQGNPALCVNDQNGDGKCDVLDAFLVLLRSMGIIL